MLHSWASNIPAKYMPQKNKTSHCWDKFRAVSPTGEQVDYTNLLQETIKTEITHTFSPLYLNMVDVLMKASQLIPLLLKGVKNHMASYIKMQFLSSCIILKIYFRKNWYIKKLNSLMFWFTVRTSTAGELEGWPDSSSHVVHSSGSFRRTTFVWRTTEWGYSRGKTN